MFWHGKKYSVRLLSIIFTLLAGSLFTYGQDFSEVEKLFDLGCTLKALSEKSAEDLTASKGSWVILTGTVASLAVINPDENNFTGQIELIDGEWSGTEQVFMYQAYVLVSGAEWVNRIPARRSRRSSPDEIPLNSNLLVVGRIADPYVDDSGYAFPVIEGHFIRIIQ